MPTVDERAMSMLIERLKTHVRKLPVYNPETLTMDLLEAIGAIATAINQLDEARAVALEEAENKLLTFSVYGRSAMISVGRAIDLIRALSNLTATSEGQSDD